MATALGPWSGVYKPDYDITVYKGGDPSKQLAGVDLKSVTSIQTSKTLDDISGTFQIVFKDRRTQAAIDPMDVLIIRMRGHNHGWGTVLRGVVDSPEPTGTAQPTTSEADMTVSGRCMGKYLQVNSMFLPVWDLKSNLPTALVAGIGAGGSTLGSLIPGVYPRTIFGHIFDNFVVGKRNMVGESGTPNARFWMNRTNRFEYVQNGSGGLFEVPFIQFDEDTCDTALTNLTVQGFTEGWVDELGNVVYRRPQWDAIPSWAIPASGLLSWDLPNSDTAMATYVEVFPGALPGLPSAQAQAMFAGRAPIPSDYVTGLQKSGFSSIASPEFIIDADSTGKVTANGAQNWYYQQQKKYGVRPYQITSPLLASREQAQAQAEGLLRFLLRLQKSGSITIPGEPVVMLGTTVRLLGRLGDQQINRTYYVEGVAHEYVEGDHYTTTLTLTHGRDPGDPGWQQMVLPNFNATQLAEDNTSGGLLQPKNSGGSQNTSYTLPASAQLPANTSNLRQKIVAAAYSGLQFKSGYSNNRPIPPNLEACARTPTDCSGFVTLCYKDAGGPDPNGFGFNGQATSYAEAAHCTKTSNPQPGDLAIWDGPGHVAMVVSTSGDIIEWGGPPGPIKFTVAGENHYHTTFLGYFTCIQDNPSTVSYA